MGISYEYEMLFTYKSDSAIRQLHSSAWHSSSNTSEVDNLMSCVKIDSKDLAYANLKDQLVVIKKAKGPSFVERTMKEKNSFKGGSSSLTQTHSVKEGNLGSNKPPPLQIQENAASWKFVFLLWKESHSGRTPKSARLRLVKSFFRSSPSRRGCNIAFRQKTLSEKDRSRVAP
ncbi:hypothetical protein Ancab_021071 [Ancistrocladus abbreviatus]